MHEDSILNCPRVLPMENNKHIEILKSWDKMTRPKPGAKMMLRYLSTNLWIFKTSDNMFGFLISGTIGQLKNNYKNIKLYVYPLLNQ